MSEMRGIQSHTSLLTVVEAARVMGIGRTLAYRMIRDRSWPTPVIQAGRLIKVPAEPLLEYVRTGRCSSGN